jgi:hypothetical protein
MEEQNLTKQKRLVLLAPDFDSRPGYEIVVFEKEGRRRSWVLKPGNTLKHRWFRRNNSLVGYAVLSQGSIRHNFSRLWQTADQKHSFTLRYRLEIAVSDPIRLVERLAGDPLKQVEDEADSALGSKARRLSWKDIVHEDESFAQRLLGEAPSQEQEEPSSLDRLKSLTLDLGLELKQIAVTRSLPETEPIVKEDVEQRKLALMQLEHETIVQKERLQLEKESLAKRREISTKKFEAVKTWVEASGKEGSRALAKLVDNISYPEGLPKAVQAVIEGAKILDGSESRTDPQISGLRSSAYLGTGMGSNGLVRFLVELIEEFEKLPCDSNENLRLLSVALHLVAEAVRGKDTKDEVIKPYKEAIKRGFDQYASVLERSQNKMFKTLIDIGALEQTLSSGVI